MTAEIGCLIILPGSHRATTAGSSLTCSSTNVAQQHQSQEKLQTDQQVPNAAAAPEEHLQERCDACIAAKTSRRSMRAIPQGSLQQEVQYVAVSNSQQVLDLLRNSTRFCCCSNLADGQVALQHSGTADSSQQQQVHSDGQTRPLGLLMPAGSAVRSWLSVVGQHMCTVGLQSMFCIIMHHGRQLAMYLVVPAAIYNSSIPVLLSRLVDHQSAARLHPSSNSICTTVSSALWGWF